MKIYHLSTIVGVCIALNMFSISYSLNDASTSRLNATMDKMYYNATDTAHVLISGSKSMPVNLEIMDSSSFQQKLSTVIQLIPNGTTTYSFNLTSFSYGIYIAKISQGYDSVKINFGVGIMPAESGYVIRINLSKYDYTPSEIIQIQGSIHPISLVRIDLIDPYGVNENSTHVTSDSSGNFLTEIGVPYSAVNGTWKINTSSGLAHSTSYITILSKNLQQNPSAKNGITSTCCYLHGSNSTNILQAPLKQFKSGITSNNITCNQGLELIFKAEDGSPACVKHSSIQKLVDWGWAKHV